MSALTETNATIESILVSAANRKEELNALINLARTLAKRIDAKPKSNHNAEFHCFKTSGKWYTSDRGILTEAVYGVWKTEERRRQILADNDGKFPGLSTTGEEFIWVVVNDEDGPGWPLLLHPTEHPAP